MSNRDDDLCYWDGEPINAMTREALQKALGDAVMIIERKNKKLASMSAKLFIEREGRERRTTSEDDSKFINFGLYLKSFR